MFNGEAMRFSTGIGHRRGPCSLRQRV